MGRDMSDNTDEDGKRSAEDVAVTALDGALEENEGNVARTPAQDTPQHVEGVARLPVPETDKFRAERASRISERSRTSAQPSSSLSSSSSSTPSAQRHVRQSESGSHSERRGKFTGNRPPSGARQPGAFAVEGISPSSRTEEGVNLHSTAMDENEGLRANIVQPERDHRQESAAAVTRAATPPSSSQQQRISSEGGVNDDDSRPMLVAELVSPPVEALKVVFDEDGEDVEAHRYQDSESAVVDTTTSTSKKPRRRKYLWGVLLLVTVLVIVIPVAILLKRDQEEEKTASSSEPEDMATAPPTFPYECYRSNYDLIGAQIQYPDQKRFIMCPGSHIKIGTLEDPANGNTNVTNGDVVMMILRSDTEVLCGEDGSVENNCVLDGGFLQVLFQAAGGPGVPGVPPGTRVDNATIRGMTMTGEIVTDPFFGGASVVASHDGKNIQFVDCKWENMTARTGLIFAGFNPYQLSSASVVNELPGKREIEMKFVNCTFQNITYGGECLINALDQQIVVERTHFSDIRLAPFIKRCVGAFASNAQDVDGWCQALISCNSRARCEVRDVCVDHFEYAGKSAIIAADYGAEIVLNGENSFHDVNALYVNENDTCPNGLAWKRSDDQISSCMILNDTDATFESSPTCHL